MRYWPWLEHVEKPLPDHPLHLPTIVNEHRPKVARRERGETQAANILSVALDLFAKHHVASVTTKQIAAASKVNSALLYYYFKNKDDLFRQAVDHAIGQVLLRFEHVQKTAHGPAEILSAWLNLHLQQVELIRKFVKVAVDYASSESRTAETDATISRFYDTERRMLCQVLQEGIETGDFAQVDVEQTATFISTFLDGIVIRSIVLEGFNYAQSVQDLRTFLSHELQVSIQESTSFPME